MPRNRFLPRDIMLCILTRLPVESLVRFKSVCKSWCELFATPEFIKMHINQFSKDPKNEALIIHCTTGEKRTRCLLSLIGSEEKKPMINLDFPAFQKFPVGISDPPGLHLLVEEMRYLIILGCLHGLVCMVSSGVDDKFVLWNPSLKLFNIVKFPILEDLELSSQYRWEYGLLRLGYDAEEADFKVVLPIHPNKENAFDKALVYSTNSDSWKKIDMGFECSVSKQYCLTGHENPYWDVKVDGKRALMYFDVRNLVFKIVPFISNWNENRVIQFMDWKGSIAALIRNFGPGANIEIWVLCDGEEKIWRKNLTFGPNDLWLCSFDLFTKNGKLIGGVRPKGKLVAP